MERLVEDHVNSKHPVVVPAGAGRRAMTVAQPTVLAGPETAIEWSWQSPSKYWKVTKVQPAHQTGRRSFTRFVFLLIEFSHVKPNGDRIVVEAYIDSKENLLRLGPFLDAAVDIPPGIRIRANTIESVPWDRRQ
jgi:hypothetical protein